jgi:hypothetical protein
MLNVGVVFTLPFTEVQYATCQEAQEPEMPGERRNTGGKMAELIKRNKPDIPGH